MTTVSDKIIGWLHRLPHFNYKFRRVFEPFNVDINRDYAQSLMFLCAGSLIVALVLLLVVAIVWIRQFCRRKSEQHLHSKCHVRMLSIGLFITCVICFFLLGGCFWGNEKINKSILLANDALSDINKNIRFSAAQTRRLNATQLEMSTHLDELTNAIEQTSKQTPGINQTTLRRVDELLTQMSDRGDRVRDSLQAISQIFVDEKFMERFAQFTNWLEFERWCIFLVLGGIVTTVLFLGVVIFSCKWQLGSIFYSGFGVVIFIVVSILFSVVFPLTVGYADLCADGRPFLRSRINDAILEMFDFYRDCAASPATRNAVPPSVPIEKINVVYQEMESDQRQLENLLYALFNRSKVVEDASRAVSHDISQGFIAIGGIDTIVGCQNLHRDAVSVQYGFCGQGFIGMTIVSASLFFLEIFLVVLLILVSKSWYIFVHRPTDYIKVNDDDHFSPRGQEMPESVYDTNIYNARAQTLNNGAVETNGSLLNGMLGNGGVMVPHHHPSAQFNSGASPLLSLNGGGRMSAIEQRNGSILAGTMLRNNGNNIAGLANRNSSNYYQLDNNGCRGSRYHPSASEFHEQYNI